MSYQPVNCVYPKTDYPWTDRLGITAPDYVGGVFDITKPKRFSAADAGTLVVTVTSSLPSSTIGVVVFLFDERNCPINVSTGNMRTSMWATNASGNYIVANGFLTFDVSYAAFYSVLVMEMPAQPINAFNLHWKVF